MSWPDNWQGKASKRTISDRRQSALSAKGARLPEENHRDNNNCHIAGEVWFSGFQTLKIVKKIILQEKIIDE